MTYAAADPNHARLAAGGGATLLHDLPLATARRLPQALALTDGATHWRYDDVAANIQAMAAGLARWGLRCGERVAIYLEKRFESALAPFGITAAGGVFVPINPLLKPSQVAYIVRDCEVRVLITSAARWEQLAPEFIDIKLLQIVFCDNLDYNSFENYKNIIAYSEIIKLTNPQFNLDKNLIDNYSGSDVDQSIDQSVDKGASRPIAAAVSTASSARVDTDIAAILYTSGSTGQPKGVVLSHRNLVAGAFSVASYLGNGPHDTLLAALPLSFDAGFSQLTTAFASGARVVLLNYLLPRDVLKVMAREQVTGLTAVPPLYIQLAGLEWPDAVRAHLRYFANTGGHMPRQTLGQLRQRVPKAQPFLMYGLTEAFRSTYLSPEQVDARPDSMGKAIPNAEILVLRPDGSLCDDDEPGELVHRGPLVAQGYWNDPDKTAERFKPLPPSVRGAVGAGLQLPEYAVFSGDTVRRDADGFLYFLGRRDEMIKTSGYRVSPVEVEEVLYGTGRVAECAAYGVAHPVLGQVIHVAVWPRQPADMPAPALVEALLTACRERMPAYMLPTHIGVTSEPLPRNANGKIDRKAIAANPGEHHVN